MVWMTRTTRYRNGYFIIEIYNNITFIIKVLVAKKIFKKILNYNSEDNSKSTNTNLFQKKYQCWKRIFIYKIIFVKYKKTRYKLKYKL